jgi:hypothetical protein
MSVMSNIQKVQHISKLDKKISNIVKAKFYSLSLDKIKFKTNKDLNEEKEQDNAIREKLKILISTNLNINIRQQFKCQENDDLCNNIVLNHVSIRIEHNPNRYPNTLNHVKVGTQLNLYRDAYEKDNLNFIYIYDYHVCEKEKNICESNTPLLISFEENVEDPKQVRKLPSEKNILSIEDYFVMIETSLIGKKFDKQQYIKNIFDKQLGTVKDMMDFAYKQNFYNFNLEDNLLFRKVNDVETSSNINNIETSSNIDLINSYEPFLMDFSYVKLRAYTKIDDILYNNSKNNEIRALVLKFKELIHDRSLSEYINL